MKAQPFMIALVVILLITGVSSMTVGASFPQKSIVEVTIDEFCDIKHVTKDIEILAGGVLAVKLGSNPTTGFKWTRLTISGDPGILQAMENKYLLPQEKDLVGAAGTEVWVFRVRQKGTATINMEYSRPWEGGEKGEWTFNLTLNAK